MRFYKLFNINYTVLYIISSVEPYNYGIVQAVERGEPLTTWLNVSKSIRQLPKFLSDVDVR
jgi:hypothetical protein